MRDSLSLDSRAEVEEDHRPAEEVAVVTPMAKEAAVEEAEVEEAEVSTETALLMPDQEPV